MLRDTAAAAAQRGQYSPKKLPFLTRFWAFWPKFIAILPTLKWGQYDPEYPGKGGWSGYFDKRGQKRFAKPIVISKLATA
jgi:hypothetical protein